MRLFISPFVHLFTFQMFYIMDSTSTKRQTFYANITSIKMPFSTLTNAEISYLKNRDKTVHVTTRIFKIHFCATLQ